MWFFQTHAGKGTVGIALMALVLAVPPSINFLAAAVLLAWAIDHLRLAFEALDAEERQESEVRATLEHQGIASECYELTTVD